MPIVEGILEQVQQIVVAISREFGLIICLMIILYCQEGIISIGMDLHSIGRSFS